MCCLYGVAWRDLANIWWATSHVAWACNIIYTCTHEWYAQRVFRQPPWFKLFRGLLVVALAGCRSTSWDASALSVFCFPKVGLPGLQLYRERCQRLRLLRFLSSVTVLSACCNCFGDNFVSVVLMSGCVSCAVPFRIICAGVMVFVL